MVWRGGTILACIPDLCTACKGRIEAFMGIWRHQRTIDRLEDRLRSLEVKCDDLERAKKGLDMEFTELYDKVSHQMSRMAKRYSRAKVNGEELPVEEEVPELAGGIDPISAKILERRNRGAYQP